MTSLTPSWWQRLLFLPPQAAANASAIDNLHVTILSITVLSALVVFAFAGYCVRRFATRTLDRTTANPWNTAAETVPAVGLLLLFLGLFAVGYQQYAAMRAPPAHTLDIYVTAKQWMWTFTYPDGHSTINTLEVPRNTPVKLVMQSRDVIHSFFVPAFRLKQDVLPGRTTSLWFTATQPGTYPILCAEYCGLEHALMRGVVQVRDDALPLQASSHTPRLWSRGAQLFQQHGCNACHGNAHDGLPGPPVAALARHDAGVLSEAILDPQAHIAPGYAPVMPSYAGVLDPPALAAIIAFLRKDVAP